MKNDSRFDLLWHVSKGTPAGSLLRRYWQPVCFGQEVPVAGSTATKILNQELVVWRDVDGGVHISDGHCPHRRAALAYGYVEGSNLRCAYHGWLFDSSGACLEKPFDPLFERTLADCLRVYPAREWKGLVFAYLGDPEKIPVFPEWDILDRDGGRVVFEIQDDLDCNWFQMQENAADVTHTYFLHGKAMERAGVPDQTGFNRPLQRYGFVPFEFGIIKTWLYDTFDAVPGYGNILVFPNILALQTEMHWRVPIDETRTRIFWADYLTPDQATDVEGDFIYQPSRTDERGVYTMNTFSSQDAMAVETQGAIADRSLERLSSSDRGILMFRKMFLDAIEANESGRDPLGLIYLPSSPTVSLRAFMGGDVPTTSRRDPTLGSPDSSQFAALKAKDHSEVVVPFGTARPRRDSDTSGNTEQV